MTHHNDTIETLKDTAEHPRMRASCGALSIPMLTALVWEINDAHQEVQDHAKGMLLAAKRAGEALLEAKKHFKSDKLFGQWRTANTPVSQRQAWNYMEVARRWSTQHRAAGEEVADLSIRQFLDIKDKPTPSPAQTFTQADAEYAQKLHAMATRGAEHEAEVAKGKLESFAKGFGMTSEEVVGKAEEVCPGSNVTARQKERDEAEEELRKTQAELRRLEELIARYRPKVEREYKDALSVPDENSPLVAFENSPP